MTTLTEQRMALIFNTWATRYANNPEDFGPILTEEGLVVNDYGINCTKYFNKIADELDAANVLPRA